MKLRKPLVRYALMMVLLVALGFPVLMMAGCGTDPAVAEAVGRAHSDAAKVRTIEAECSGPCKINYTDPRDRPQMALPTNGWDALRGISKDLTGLASGVAPWVAAGTVAVEGLKRAGGNDSSVSTTTTTTSNTTDDHSTATTTTNTDSGNTTTNTTTDRHDVTTTTDSTHTPTVVLQPPPVIVGP